MSDAPEFDRYEGIPLRICRDGHGYSVKLAGIELKNHLLAEGGVEVRLVDAVGGHPAQPAVTLRFAPDGAVDLDLDAELVAYLKALEGGATS